MYFDVYKLSPERINLKTERNMIFFTKNAIVRFKPVVIALKMTSLASIIDLQSKILAVCEIEVNYRISLRPAVA